MKYLFGDCRVDVARRELTCNGEPVALEPQTFELLTLLLQHRDRAVSKEEIFETVWSGRAITDGVLTTRIRSLRRAIDPNRNTSHIKTLHRVGYRFDSAVQTIGGQTEATGANSPDDMPADGLGAVTEADDGIKTAVQQSMLPDDGSTIPAGKPSIAILPLDNMSSNADQDFFSDGMSEDILTELSRFSEISVTARNSSFAFRGQNLTVPEIGRKLGARYVLEGSVRRAGNRVRITVQLIDAVEDNHVWAEKYDRDVGDLFAVQDEVTLAIVAKLLPQVSLSESKRALRAPPENLDAWGNYHRGLTHLYQYKPDMQDTAIQFFDRAIEISPTFADAYAALSYSICVRDMGLFDPDKPNEAASRAKECAMKAVELDDQSPFGWISLARTHILLGAADLGVTAAEKAVELNPNDPRAHYLHAYTLWLSGSVDEALETCDRTIAIGKFERALWGVMSIKACALATLDRFDEAIEWSRKTRDQPVWNSFAYFGEICALGHLDRIEEARDLIHSAENVPVEKRAFEQLDLATVRRSCPITDAAVAERFYGGFTKVGLVDGGSDASLISGNRGRARQAVINEARDPTGKPSIAILPLDNMSGDKDQDYFSDGMSEDILTELSRFSEISVMARNSSFAFRDQNLTVPEIGQKLGARYVLEGSVRRAGNRVRITVQLIDAVEDAHVWAEKYDRDIEDLFAVQDDVTHAIVKALLPHVSLSERKRALRKPPENLDAWENHQRGLVYLHAFDTSNMETAISFFEKAIELDPNFAEAHAGLSYFCSVFGIMSEPGPGRDAACKRAQQTARHAITLDERSPLARVAHARSELLVGAHEEAISAAKVAIELNPSLAAGYYILGQTLWHFGQPAEAVVALDKALGLSPFDWWKSPAIAGKACALAMLGQYEEAITLSRQAQLEDETGNLSFLGEICALGHLEREEDAHDALNRANQVFGKSEYQNVLTLDYVDQAVPIAASTAKDHFFEGLRKAKVPQAGELGAD